MITQMYTNMAVQLIEVDLTMEQIWHACQHPVSLPKDEVPLWNFISIKDGMPHERHWENYGKIFAIILDFDGGLSIQDFEDRYSRYSYFLYTSSSHKDWYHRYRVVLPLAEPLSYANTFRQTYTKKSIYAIFPEADKTCLSNFHKIPAVPTDGISKPYCNYHVAERYHISNHSVEGEAYRYYKKEHENMQMAQEARRKLAKLRHNDKSCARQKQGARRWAEKKVMEIPTTKGDRYAQFRKLIPSLAHWQNDAGDYMFDIDECLEILEKHPQGRNADITKLARDLYEGIQ